MTTEKKILIFGILFTILVIFLGIFLTSRQEKRLSKPLVGQEVSVTGIHVSNDTEIDYNSNPPAGGEHYGDSTTPAGVYDIDSIPADGYLVHSLEHGAVIFWYDPEKLSKDEIEKLRDIYNQTSGKAIMTPREKMDTPVAVSSWGRVLKFEKIDEDKIKEFFEINVDRGPEKAPI